METTVSINKSSKRWGIVPVERSVAAHPLLLEEYSPENELPPDQVYAGTGKKLKWICSKCGHKWEVKGNNRRYGCPACAHKVTTSTYSLAVLYPDLAREFSLKNLPLTAQNLVSGSHKVVWWDCSKKNCGHQWRTSVKNRTQHGSGCPACAGNVTMPQNNLAITHPQLAKHYSGKNKQPARRVIAGTHHKLLWNCPFCGNEFLATGVSRVRANHTLCPKCARSQKKRVKVVDVVEGRKSFSELYPHLVPQYSRLNPIPPDKLFLDGKDPIISWRCQKEGHQWRARLSARLGDDIGCPDCVRKRRREK